MKAQKLGLVLGINMAAACLMMQGCKATKPGGEVQTTSNKPVITISSPAPRTERVTAPAAQQQAMQAQSAQQGPVISNMPPPAEPGPAVQDTPPAEPQPSAVRKIKPLSTAQAKPPKSAKVKSASAPAASAPAAAPVTEYVVKSGDTLFLISKRTNYRQAAILAANPGLNPDRIRVGQKIKLPGAAESAAAPANVAKAAAPAAKSADKDAKVKPAAAPAPAAANTKAPVKTKGGFVPYEGPTKDYVVKSGDSLGQIACDCGISIRALKALNGLQHDSLRAGQKLKVPAEKQTVAKAAPAAKAASTKVAAAKPAAAAKGDDAKASPAVQEAAAPAPAAETAKPEVAAPAATPAPAAEAAKPEEAAQPAVEEAAVPTHTVKEGEDLVSIAIAYGISPSALMDINDLKATDTISPGQVLKLPPNAKRSDG